MSKYAIGVDIGGTTVKLGLFNLNGVIIEKWDINTNRTNKGHLILRDIWNSINQHLFSQQITQKEILGIGVGAPGFVDNKKGVVHEAVNIGWKDIDLSTKLSNLSSLPVYVENDANLAALGENWKGAGENNQDIIVITLGTGVGGGIIVNGELLNGSNGTAGEIGHIIIDPNGYPCNCGRKGCLDTIASGNGIVRQALEKIPDYPNSLLVDHYQEHHSITAKDIFDFAAQGDPLSEQIIDYTADVLGSVIANTALITNPSKILIGGGVSKAGEQFINKIKNYFSKYTLPRTNEGSEIKIAELGNDAGIIGAAYLVLQNQINTIKMDP
nr:ROK family glucokinase [Fredinandcohnia onubensis]